MTDTKSALDEVKREAVRWLVRLRAEDLSEAETLAFADWLSRDYHHSQAFAAAEDALNTMAFVASHSSKLAGTEQPPVHRVKNQANRRTVSPSAKWLTAGLAMAAVWLFAVLLVMPGQSQPFADYLSDYHTATGELREIGLADGSRLLLNTNTAVSVDFNDAVRQIRLHHGQARFQVAAEPGRPFQVLTGDLQVRALGTVFDVYAGADGQTQITVEEHAVMATALGRDAGQDGIEIQQGQQLRYRRGQAAKPEAVDLAMTAAWQQQQLFINDRPLAELVKELERYRVGRIFITDDSLRQQHVTGVFPLEHPDQVLESLDKILGIRSTRLGLWVVLHR